MKLRGLVKLGVLTDTQRCVEFLREYGLLAKRRTCLKCHGPMREEKAAVVKEDGTRWRCQTSNCRTTCSIRKGSFFQQSNINLIDLVLLIYGWALDFRHRQIAYECSVSARTVVEWARNLREVCSVALSRNARKIGGAGEIVAVDETLIAKRKRGNAQGRPVKPMWLFGGASLTSNEVFIALVPEVGRKANVMEALIQKHIAPGTEIWSDCFPSYNNINKLPQGYTHRTVNHSYCYINRDGIHTNNIESLWGQVKSKMKRMHGVARHLIPGYLNEWEWRRGFKTELHFLEILKAIAEDPKYNVNGL